MKSTVLSVRHSFRPMIRHCSMWAAGLILAASSAAWAAPTPEDVALSEALFREGKTLLQEGKFDLACPKLAESHRLDPAGGTLVTLGLCYEAAGKTASAWVVFGDALASAERDKRADRVKLAKEHIAALEAKLSYLTIELAPEGIGTTDFTLTRDGANVNRAALGTASAVDPGKHVITVAAVGFNPRQIEIEVGANGDRKKVVVPALERIPEKPPEEKPPEDKPVEKPVEKPIETPKPIVPVATTQDTAQGMHPGRIGALVVGGASLIALISGSYFGARAKSQHDEALKSCPASPCSNKEGVGLNDAAKSDAAASTGLVVGGLIGAAGSIALWVAFPNKPAPSRTPTTAISVIPVIGTTSAGTFVVGAF